MLMCLVHTVNKNEKLLPVFLLCVFLKCNVTLQFVDKRSLVQTMSSVSLDAKCVVPMLGKGCIPIT